MSSDSQWGNTALTFIRSHLEEMGHTIRKVLVGCYFYTSVSLCVRLIISFSLFQETVFNKCCWRWHNGVSVNLLQIFRVKRIVPTLPREWSLLLRSKLLFSDNKCMSHHILIGDRLPANAAGTLCHIWMFLQQMDQRCAVHSKSGTLNNSATSCVTLTAV